MEIDRELLIEIGENPPARLDRALAQFLPAGVHISRSRMTSLIRKGLVSIAEEFETEPARRAVPGEIWKVRIPVPEDSTIKPEAIDLAILHEDDDVIVLDKAPGMVVHPARGNWTRTLVNAILHHCGDSLRGVGDVRRPGIVHRLDKDTSGVMVVAKSERAVDALAMQFEERTASRTYWAIVRGIPDVRSRFAGFSGISFERDGVVRIETELDRHPKYRHKVRVVQSGGRRAVTRARVLKQLANGLASLVECKLETGRTHQIRVHMSHVGHPLVGDPLYGSSARILPADAGDEARNAVVSFERQALHAVALEFVHPATCDRQRFESGLPDDMAGLLATLSGPGPQAPD